MISDITREVMESFDHDHDDLIGWREFLEFIDKELEVEERLVGFLKD